MKKFLVGILVLALGIACIPFVNFISLRADGLNENSDFYIALSSTPTTAITEIVPITKGEGLTTFVAGGSLVGGAGTLTWELYGEGDTQPRDEKDGATYSIGWIANEWEDEIGVYELRVRNFDGSIEASINIRIRYYFPPTTFWTPSVTSYLGETVNPSTPITPGATSSGTYGVLFNTQTIYEVEIDWETLLDNVFYQENANPDPIDTWEINGVVMENLSLNQHQFKHTQIDSGSYEVIFKRDDEVIHTFYVVSGFDNDNIILLMDSAGAELVEIFSFSSYSFTIFATQLNPNANPEVLIDSFVVVKKNGNTQTVVTNIIAVMNSEGGIDISIPKNTEAGTYLIKVVTSVSGNSQDFKYFKITIVAMQPASNSWIQVLIFGGIAAALGGAYLGLNRLLKIHHEKRALKMQMEAEIAEEEGY